MDTDYLRSATRAEHEGTEATVPLMDPGLTLQQYIESLHGMLRAVGPWDDWASIHCPADLLPLMRGRRRSGLLRADLAHLDADAPSLRPFPAATWFPDATRNPEEFAAAFLGAMYVVEGSTLGGQYIARHVEEVFSLRPGAGNSYFCGYGENTGSMWKEFKAVLASVPERHTELVVSSAKEMFRFFAAQMADKPRNAE